MQRCRLTNVAVELLPIVGAIETREQNTSWSRDSFQESRILSKALGIGPSFYQGGAPWFAIAQSSAKFEGQTPAAAAIERHERALQSVAARSTAIAHLRNLIASAGKAIRLRHHINLAKTLSSNRRYEFGTKAFPEQIVKNENRQNIAAIFVDYRLQIEKQTIKSTASFRTNEPAKLFVFDFALRGNSLFTTKLHAKQSAPFFLKIRIIDQECGEPIGETSARFRANERLEMSISLPKIYGQVAIVFEFSGAANLTVVVEKMSVH
jgi:hypothetical protein